MKRKYRFIEYVGGPKDGELFKCDEERIINLQEDFVIDVVDTNGDLYEALMVKTGVLFIQFKKNKI